MNPSDALIAIGQILSHTPRWVWGVLGLIVAIGVRQLRDYTVGRTRLVALPIAFIVFSAWGVSSSFRAMPAPLAAWAVALAAGIAAGCASGWPGRASYDAASDRFTLPGSVLPMLLMLAIFGVRYGAGVTISLHPDWAGHAAFALPMSVLYGLPSGLFAARALNVLRRTARPPLGFAA